MSNSGSFGDSPSSRVISGILSNRGKVNGLYVPDYQSRMISDSLRTEIAIIPSSSAPSFGGVCILDFREKNCVLHNLCLNLNLTPVTGISGGTNPNLNPGNFFFDRIEMFVSGVCMHTIFGVENHLLNQILENDEQRIARNYGTALYSSAVNRNTFFTAGGNYYINLKSFIDVIRPTILNDSHNIQFKVYFNTLGSVFNAVGGTGTPVCSMNSASLVAKITRLDQNTASYKLQELTKMGSLHTMYHETKPMTAILNSGITTTNIVLSALSGNIACLWFVIRPTSGLSGSGMWNFLQIRSFALVSSSGENLVGGSQIPALLSTSILNTRWSKSTYCTETSLGGTDNAANYYCWSFSADPVASLKDGCDFGSRKFTGSEQLQITFNSALASTHQIDIYAYSECIADQTLSGIRKIVVN